MLRSLFSTNPPGDLTIHLLHDESLMARDLARLQTIASEAGGRLSPLGGLERHVEGLLRSDRFPANIWYRLLAPELLNEVDRILYVDVDIVVTDSLAPLWKLDLGGKVLGAVTNPLPPSLVPRLQTELGMPRDVSYFNSGVLLIDALDWRQSGVGNSLRQFLGSHRDLPWPDQDALNAVLHSRRLELHPRWNALPGLWHLSDRRLPWDPAETCAARSNPAIVHFVGLHKPWHYRNRSPYRRTYFTYLSQTPWRGRAVEGRSLSNALLRRLPWMLALRLEMRWQESYARLRWLRGHARTRLAAARARMRQ